MPMGPAVALRQGAAAGLCHADAQAGRRKSPDKSRWRVLGMRCYARRQRFQASEVVEMAKKKSRSVVGMIGEAVSDLVDAASVAATGSQLGVLELAAEEELQPTPKRKRKTKAAAKKKKAVVKSKKKTKKKKTKKKAAAKRRR
jgi:hypothetical protein